MAPTLVYIASIGRSGSTLMELLLGAHPDMATLGELHLWPHEIASGSSRLPCGCGLSLEDCPFWQEMRRREDPLSAAPPRLDAFREHLNHGRALRVRRLRDFRSRLGSSADIDAYGANTERILEAFSELTEADTGRRPSLLIDASKDPYRLAWLIRSGRFDLHIVHIVRDPRGFVQSERKNVPGLQGWRLLRLAARKALAWRLHNLLVRRSAGLLPNDHYHLIRYEELAAEPERVMAELQAELGVVADPTVVDTFRDRRFHAVGGNPMRHQSGGIRLDERWRTELPLAAQRLTRVLTASTPLDRP